MIQPSSCLLIIKVIPNATANAIVGFQGDLLKVKITAVPERGKANEALISFLADYFDVAAKDVIVISGHAARIKRIRVPLTQEAVRHRITG